MVRKFIFSLFILIFSITPLFATLAVSNMTYTGKVTKIQKREKIVVIGSRKFHYNNNIYNELKLFKKLKKNITVKFKKIKNRFIIEKIILKIEPLRKKGKY